MPKYRLDVEFVFTTQFEIEAENEVQVEAMFVNANHDEIAHLNGKSYADVSDAERFVKEITLIE